MSERPKQNRDYRRSYYARNRERAIGQARAWKVANPQKNRDSQLDSHLRRTYGMTLGQYRDDVIGQAGRCLICGLVPAVGRLHVDHDHATGRYRGLLCSDCNKLLGLARDNVRLLASAARYLGGQP